MTDFVSFTKIPIVIYYGDNIPQLPTMIPGEEQWRVFFQVARLWADAVNRHGGDATVVHLPQIGITGNTHFPFSDLNNIATTALSATVSPVILMHDLAMAPLTGSAATVP